MPVDFTAAGHVPWITSICLSLLQCMMPLPSNVIDAEGNFLVTILLAICTAVVVM